MKQYRSSSLMSTGSGCSPPTAPAPKDNEVSIARVAHSLKEPHGFRVEKDLCFGYPEQRPEQGRGVLPWAVGTSKDNALSVAQIGIWLYAPAVASAQTCASLPNSIRVAVASVGSGARKNAPLNQGQFSVNGVGVDVYRASAPKLMEVNGGL